MLGLERPGNIQRCRGLVSPLKEHVIVRRSDITGAWITVILLFIIIIIRFFPR